LIEDMRLKWRELDRRIAALSAEFVTQARGDQAARRLATIPGFGALNATAPVAAIGTAETFGRACRITHARAGARVRLGSRQKVLISISPDRKKLRMSIPLYLHVSLRLSRTR
jgi:transposase